MPTDTERLDFLEKLGREHEAFMRAAMISDPGPFAWAECYSSLTISIADSELFHHATARASIDAAMARAGSERSNGEYLDIHGECDTPETPEQPKPAAVPFSDTEPDEPVVQEASAGLRYFEPSAQEYFTTEVNPCR